MRIQIKKKLLKRIAILAFLFIVGLIMAYSVSYPSQGLNPYYNALAQWFNVSHNFDGTLKKGLNVSLEDVNITNTLLITNITATGIINSTNGSFTAFTVTFLNVQSINGTDLSLFNKSVMLGSYQLLADFIANYSKEYSSTGYDLGNLSDDLSNAKVATIKTTTGTFDFVIVNKELLVFGNISNVNLTNINVNATILPSLDALFDLGNGTFRWQDGNFTGTLEVGSITATTTRTTNLQDLDSSNFFDNTGLSSQTITSIDQTGAVTFTSISITESQISNLGVYEWRTTAYGFTNLTNNIGIPNASIISIKNLTEDKLNVSNASQASRVPCSGVTGAIYDVCAGDGTGSGATSPFNSTSSQIKANDSTISMNWTGDFYFNSLLSGSAQCLGLAANGSVIVTPGACNTSISLVPYQLEIPAWHRINTTDQIGDNASFLRQGQNDTYIRNIVSNNTPFSSIQNVPPFINITSVSNDSLRRGDNQTSGAWNYTESAGRINIFQKIQSWVYAFGFANSSKNISTNSTVLGVYGDFYLNGTFNGTGDINLNDRFNVSGATGNIWSAGTYRSASIFQNGNQVQTINSIWNGINDSSALNTYNTTLNAYHNANIANNDTSMRADQYTSINWSNDWNAGYVAAYINTTNTKNVLTNGTDARFINLTTANTNTSFGNFFIADFNSTCTGFRRGVTGPPIASCTT